MTIYIVGGILQVISRRSGSLYRSLSNLATTRLAFCGSLSDTRLDLGLQNYERYYIIIH